MLLRMLTQALCTTEAAGYLRGEVWESNKFWHLKMIIYLPAGLAQEASEVEAQLEALAGVGDLEVVVTGRGELGEQLLLLHGEGLGQHVRHWSVPLVHRGLKHLVETRPLVADLEELGEGGEVTELLCEHGHVLPRHRGVIQDVEISKPSNVNSQSPFQSFISIFRITVPEKNLVHDVEQDWLRKSVEAIAEFGEISDDGVSGEVVKRLS